MAKMGRYCKAYSMQNLREFVGWEEKPLEEGKGGETKKPATNDAYVYLQENFTITEGIFLDEGIIFDNVTPEWVEFCKNRLDFEVPAWEAVKKD